LTSPDVPETNILNFEEFSLNILKYNIIRKRNILKKDGKYLLIVIRYDMTEKSCVTTILIWKV